MISKTTKVRIGANPIGWSNDDLQSIGGTTSLDACLSQARRAGVEGMELGFKFPRTAPEIRAALAPHGLDFISGWWSTNLLAHSVADEIEAFQARLELLKGMESRLCIVAETSNAIHAHFDAPLSTRPVLSEVEWPVFARRMTEFADYLRGEGIQLVYHHHMGTVVQSRADIARLMDSAGPSVKLLFDTGHALWGGSDPIELARTYGGRIGHVHTKDVRPFNRAKADVNDWSFLRSVLSGVYTVPGDGCIDYAQVFRALPDYTGWVVVEAEQDPAIADPLIYTRMGFNHLQQILRETGHIAAM